MVTSSLAHITCRNARLCDALKCFLFIRISMHMLLFHSWALHDKCCYASQVCSCGSSCFCSKLFAGFALVPMSIAGLEGELAAVNERQLELKHEFKHVSRKQAKTKKRTCNDLASLLQELGTSSETRGIGQQISPRLARHEDKMTLLALCKLADQCADAVTCWALGHGGGGFCTNFVRIDPELRRQVANGVEWLYILSSEEDINNSVESVVETVQCLGRYVVEYSLFLWTVKQNCENGVAPQNRQLFAAAAQCVPIAMPDHVVDNLKNFFLQDTRRLRCWSVQFRNRWGVKPGRLCAGENFDPQILQNKVPWVSSDMFEISKGL